MSGNIVHVVNWGIWGGVQSVVLALAREYSEYNSHVLLMGEQVNFDLASLFFRYGVSVKYSKDLEADLKIIDPKYTFLHNTHVGFLDKLTKGRNYVRVHHGCNIGEWCGAEFDWFVSKWVRDSYKGIVKNEILLPPLITTSDFFKKEVNFNDGNLENPTVGKVQSTTVAGNPTPNSYYEAVNGYKKFIVGKGRDIDAPVIAGLTIDYLLNVDILAICQEKLESWGLSLTEANLMGIPAIVRRNNDGMTEQAERSGGAILVDNISDFKESVEWLKDEYNYRVIGERGRLWCKKNVDSSLLREYI